MTNKKIPFVGLHAHSVAGSIFDAIGYPDEHMDYCYENGGEALALTDHGNMNGFSHQFLHWQKMQAEGKEFKPIFGVEAYFLPSIEEWREDYDRIKEDAKLAKTLAKDGTAGATVEDEEASKKAVKSVVNRRSHLVLLAQNQTGLSNLFKLISESYKRRTSIVIRVSTISYSPSIPKVLSHHQLAWVVRTPATIGRTETMAQKLLWRR